MPFSEDDSYDSHSRQSSNSGDSGYFGCDNFKDECSDEDVEIIDMSEEGDPILLKDDTLFAWWDRITEESLPFWAAMEEEEPDEDAPKKERLAYIFKALESGIQGFTIFTRALCSAIEDRNQQLVELELENRTLVMRNSTLTIERDLLTKERDDLEKEATHLVMRCSTITFERDEVARECDEARRERDALKKGMEQMKEQNKSLHYEVGLQRGALKTELEQLKIESDEIRTEVKKQKIQNSFIKKERDDLRVAVDSMRGDAPYHVLARWMETPGFGF